MQFKKFPERFWRHWLSAPFIYGMFFPIVILDISLEIYQQICFRFYGLPLVDRSKYIRIDRHKLKYLKWYEKINCAYCGYANGVAHYFTVIAEKTENYWCGIKHSKDPNFIPPEHHQDFIEYGDEPAYRHLTK